MKWHKDKLQVRICNWTHADFVKK